jgi:DNA-binding NarL/FixJ family response regulator
VGLRSGARGYLLKDTNRETLFHAIRAAVRGEMLLQPEMMTRALALTLQKPEPHSSDMAGIEGTELSEREREIPQGVARGEPHPLGTHGIASSLNASRSSVYLRFSHYEVCYEHRGRPPPVARVQISPLPPLAPPAVRWEHG